MDNLTSDPMLPVGTRFCKCSGCEEYFNSPAAFDTHRQGKGAVRSCEKPANCGLVVNKKGYWSKPWMT